MKQRLLTLAMLMLAIGMNVFYIIKGYETVEVVKNFKDSITAGIVLLGFVANLVVISIPLVGMRKNMKDSKDIKTRKYESSLNVLEYINKSPETKYFTLIFLGLNLLAPLIVVLVKFGSLTANSNLLYQYLGHIYGATGMLIIATLIAREFLYTAKLISKRNIISILYFITISSIASVLLGLEKYEYNNLIVAVLILIIIINSVIIIFGALTHYSFVANRYVIKLPNKIFEYSSSLSNKNLTVNDQKILLQLLKKGNIISSNEKRELIYENQKSQISNETTDKYTPYIAFVDNKQISQSGSVIDKYSK
jgi:hypothetical protein